MAVDRSWICRGCWEQMRVPIPIRGPLAFPFRMFGIRTSQMHPNLCTICETNFTRVKKQKQVVITATVMFADLRGYTRLSEEIGGAEAARMLNGFYDICCSSVWERDGVVNKFIGDAVLAVFNFPLDRNDHARRAVLAGLELLRCCRERKPSGGSPGAGARDDTPLGVGIGIHTGTCTIGEVGTAYRDFTVIGPVVNMAARLQGIAEPGEIVVSEDVYRSVRDLSPEATPRMFALKGIDHDVPAYVLRA